MDTSLTWQIAEAVKAQEVFLTCRDKKKEKRQRLLNVSHSNMSMSLVTFFTCPVQQQGTAGLNTFIVPSRFAPKEVQLSICHLLHGKILCDIIYSINAICGGSSSNDNNKTSNNNNTTKIPTLQPYQ